MEQLTSFGFNYFRDYDFQEDHLLLHASSVSTVSSFIQTLCFIFMSLLRLLPSIARNAVDAHQNFEWSVFTGFLPAIPCQLFHQMISSLRVGPNYQSFYKSSLSHIQNCSTCIAGGSQGHSHIWRFAGRTHRTQNLVLLTAEIYHSGTVRRHSQIIRGNVSVDPGEIHQWASLCCLPPKKAHIQCFLPLALKNSSTSAMFLPGEAHQGVSAQFSWGLVMQALWLACTKIPDVQK